MQHSYMVKVLRVGEPMPSLLINSPNVARRYWNSVIKMQPWFDEGKEHLVVLLLSTRLGIDGYSLVSIGSLSESMAHPREIFRAAVAFGAYAIVIMHNHPSGDPRPSEQDRSITNRLVQAAQILQIHVLDHVIVGRRRLKALTTNVSARTTRKAREAQAICRQGYYSFKEAGYF